jgi:hypothetical protein
VTFGIGIAADTGGDEPVLTIKTATSNITSNVVHNEIERSIVPFMIFLPSRNQKEHK